MIEALAIRFLYVLHALRPKKTPGLCPPACEEGHTYKWPCRARIPAIQKNLNRQTKKIKHMRYYD